MKKVSLLFTAMLLVISLLCGCGHVSPAVITGTTAVASSGTTDETAGPLLTRKDQTLNYPGLVWGMSSDQVVEALALENTDYTHSSEFRAEVTGVEVFGAVAEEVVFVYAYEQKLCRVMVHFPDDADMMAVKDRVTEWYGEPAESYERYDYNKWQYADEVQKSGMEVHNGLPYLR